MSFTKFFYRTCFPIFFISLINLSFSQNSLDWAISNSSFLNDISISDLEVHNGSVYSVGTLRGTVDLDPGAGVFNVSSNGGYDFYIQKLDASTGNFIWGGSIGSTSTDFGQAIEIDANGNIYLTGSFNGTVDFDPGPGVFNLTSTGSGGNIFILKLNSFGSFVWAKSLPGFNFGSKGYDIAVDINYNVYITGDFNGSVDFDPGAASDISTAVGGQDVFVVKFNSLGNLIWAKTFGGSSFDSGSAIHVDAAGYVYSTGTFFSTADLDPGPGIQNFTANVYDAYIQKLDPSGNLVWVKQIVGNSDGISINVDASGNVYNIGRVMTTADFDPNAGTVLLTPNSGIDTYILKLNSAGLFDWAVISGSLNEVLPSSIEIDAYDDIYISGWFNGSADFDPGADTVIKTSNGDYDMYIQKLNSAGNFIWAESFGGAARDYCSKAVSDNNGGIFISGYFDQTVDFDPGSGVFNLVSAFSEDAFVLKLTECPLDDASFNYSAASYCVNDSDPTPTITGLAGGTFSSTAGLSINGGTGAIDVSASIPGTYTVTYTTSGACPNSSNVSVTINTLDNASFNYSAASYCVNDSDPTPTITGLAGGTFSSTAGLSINGGTGAIDVSASIPGTYTVTYTTSGTCPSSSNVMISIGSASASMDIITACNTYTWIDGNTYTASNNSATFNIVGGAANGCDSLVTLELTINRVSDITTSISGVTISANNTGASYQWLDCDNNFSEIAGETGQSFTVSLNGNYAVELTENGCKDTTSCVAITTVGIAENSFGNHLTIYPNPTSGNFTIDLGSIYESSVVSITDILGKLVDSKTTTQTQILNLEINEPAGVYIISIQSSDRKAIFYLIKE